MRAKALLAALTLCLFATPAAGDDDEIASHAEAVTRLVMERNIQVGYDYVATLMRLPNAFGEGAACVLCHGSSDPKRSYRGLNLTTCEGIVRGATEPPTRPILTPGQGRTGLLWRYLQHNRMPFGVDFDYPQDTANIRMIKDWIDAGAKNDAHFQQNVLPLFLQQETFGIEHSCGFCHMSSDSESANQLDLTSYKGIMLGAWSARRARQGQPPEHIVVPGNAANSRLYQRLVENRMPAGIDPAESADHPNTMLLMRWVEQGATCD